MTFGARPEIVPIDEREKGAESDVLPGSSSIGHTYDIFGRYSMLESIGRPLFDLGPLVIDEQIGLRRPERTYVNPDSPVGTIEQIIGKTVREYQEDLSVKAGLSGKYGFFSGEIGLSYDRSAQQISTVQFVETRDKYTCFKLYLAPASAMREHLSPEVRKLVDSGPIDELLGEYGTHYLQAMLIGARASYCCAIETSSYSHKVAISAAAKLSYQSLIGHASGSMSQDQKNAVTFIQEHSSARVFVQGGDVTLAGGLLDGAFSAWRESVRSRPAFSDLVADSLVPVSRLAEGERARAIDRAIAERLATHPQAPLPTIHPVYARNIRDPNKKGQTSVLSRWYYGLSADGPPFWSIRDEVPFYAFQDAGSHPELVPVYRYSAGGPERYLLSRDPNYGHGWARGDVAFHAFAAPAPDRVPIDGYACDDHANAGNHYRVQGTKVGRWSVRQPSVFYVPKLG